MDFAGIQLRMRQTAIYPLLMKHKGMLFPYLNVPAQKLANPFLCMTFDGGEPFFRPVDRRMPLESEADQPPELPCLCFSHHFGANTLEGDITVGRESCHGRSVRGTGV